MPAEGGRRSGANDWRGGDGPFAQKQFCSDNGELTDREEIGRLLVTRYTAGARMWCSLRILRSLGVLVDCPPTVHRMGSRSTAKKGQVRFDEP